MPLTLLDPWNGLIRRMKMSFLKELPGGKVPATFWRDVRTWGFGGAFRSSEGRGPSWVRSWGGSQGLDHQGLPLLCWAFWWIPKAMGSPSWILSSGVMWRVESQIDCKRQGSSSGQRWWCSSGECIKCFIAMCTKEYHLAEKEVTYCMHAETRMNVENAVSERS